MGKRTTAGGTAVAAVDTAVATAPASATAATSAATGASCPATGLWSQCAIVQRLERAGLVPRVDSTRPTEPPLRANGVLIHLGTSEVEIYFYPDVQTRERDERTLDQSKYVAYDAPLSMKPLPTLIHSANAIAILHSRNDHLRERVSDAITAGPPQPVK